LVIIIALLYFRCFFCHCHWSGLG